MYPPNTPHTHTLALTSPWFGPVLADLVPEGRRFSAAGLHVLISREIASDLFPGRPLGPRTRRTLAATSWLLLATASNWKQALLCGWWKRWSCWKASFNTVQPTVTNHITPLGMPSKDHILAHYYSALLEFLTFGGQNNVHIGHLIHPAENYTLLSGIFPFAPPWLNSRTYLIWLDSIQVIAIHCTSVNLTIIMPNLNMNSTSDLVNYK